MKSRSSSREQNKMAAASLLAELEEEAQQEFQAKTGNKVETNRQQTGNKLLKDEIQNQEQTGNKVETKWERDPVEKTETGNKVVSQLGTGVGTKWEQTGNKLATDRDVSTLRGLQKRVLVFLYHSCLKARSQNTERLAVQKIAESCETSVQSVKVTIRRLEKMKLVERKSFENGRGGWTVYSLPNAVHSYLRLDETENKVGTNQEQTGNKVVSQLGTQLGTSPSSSSRDLYSKESSTTQPPKFDELASLDVSGLRDYGITVETFKRAVQLHPTVSIESLSDLCFRLTELFKNPKERARIQNARGFVIKLVEQLAGGVTPLDHIETAHERLMREYAQAAAKKRSDQQGYEESLLQAAFEKWDQETELEEKFQAVPLAQRAPAGSPQSAIFKEYFREKLWPETREAMLKGEA